MSRFENDCSRRQEKNDRENFIVLFNAADFAELYEEDVRKFFPIVISSRTLRRISAVFPTSLILAIMPMLVFGLRGEIMILCIIVFNVVYVVIYISLYFWIKKKKEEFIEGEKR